MRNRRLAWLLFSAALLILGVQGCTSTSYVLTGTSSTSTAAAANDLHGKLREAEGKRCRAIGIGTGTGIGFSADECSADDTIEDQTVYSVQVLVKCPEGAELDIR